MPEARLITPTIAAPIRGDVCPDCGDIIQPGQLFTWARRPGLKASTKVHVACPAPRQIEHAVRMGRRTL